MSQKIAIIGSQGAIGQAWTNKALDFYGQDCLIHTFSRQASQKESSQVEHHQVDYFSDSFIPVISQAAEGAPFNLVVNCTGILHEGHIQPEKSLRDIQAHQLARIYEVNTILPALLAKYFMPHIDKEHRAIFACLSARVGSIEDNHLGGWYAYRMSKASLNMLIKNIAIEVNRFHPELLVLALHPGTVKSGLSKPFSQNVPEYKLFTPQQSVDYLWDVLLHATKEQSGRCLAWDGKIIDY